VARSSDQPEREAIVTHALNEFVPVAVGVKNAGFPMDAGGQVEEMILATEIPQAWYEGNPHHRAHGCHIRVNVGATPATLDLHCWVAEARMRRSSLPLPPHPEMPATDPRMSFARLDSDGEKCYAPPVTREAFRNSA
jgi:hypothetical protein